MFDKKRLLGALIAAFAGTGLCAQDYSVTIDFTDIDRRDGDFTFLEGQREDSGFLSGPGTDDRWSWVREGDDFEVYNNKGELLFTVEDFFLGITEGDVIDNPDIDGDWSGKWSR